MIDPRHVLDTHEKSDQRHSENLTKMMNEYEAIITEQKDEIGLLRSSIEHMSHRLLNPPVVMVTEEQLKRKASIEPGAVNYVPPSEAKELMVHGFLQFTIGYLFGVATTLFFYYIMGAMI